VHRAVQAVLNRPCTDPFRDPFATPAQVIEAAKSADSGGATADGADRAQILQTLAQLTRLGLYRCSANDWYTR
jgi:hypothetical protein